MKAFFYLKITFKKFFFPFCNKTPSLSDGTVIATSLTFSPSMDKPFPAIKRRASPLLETNPSNTKASKTFIPSEAVTEGNSVPTTPFSKVF